MSLRLARLAMLACVMGAWELVGLNDRLARFLSSPTRMVRFGWDALFSGELFRHTWTTTYEMLIGYLIGSLLGAVLGIILGRSHWWARVLDPVFVLVNAAPKMAVAPIFVIWFGIGILSKVAAVVSLVFFLVFYNTYKGTLETPVHLVNAIKQMGASESYIMRRVVLPSVLPWLFIALKVAVPYAMIGAIIGEFVASTSGLGFWTARLANNFNMTGTLFAVLVMVVVVLILSGVIEWMERRLVGWRDGHHGASSPNAVA